MEVKYDITNDSYLKFIGELRGNARDGDKYSHARPILPLKSNSNPSYIYVKLLKDGVDKGRAMIRRYDLRLMCFQHIIGHSIVSEKYNLYDDRSKLLDFGIDGFLLGLPTFVNAVDSLADCIKTKDMGTRSVLVMCNQKQRINSIESSVLRTSLAVLCLVLCEAAKLDFFSCLLGNAFKSGFNVHLNSWLLHRINDWRSFSKVLLFGDHPVTNDCNYYLPDETNDWHDGKRVIGVTCQDIARFVGILKPIPVYDFMPADYLPGTCLLEVYSVRVYIKGGRSGNLYGSIKINNGYSTFLIYDRDRSDCEFVESHGILSLQDPGGFITVSSNIDMMVDIVEEGGEGDSLEITKGKVTWGSYLGRFSYESRLSAMVRGKNGYAIVNYSVFKNAIQAHVEVRLMKKGGDNDNVFDNHVCVHGRLTACYCDFTYALDHEIKYKKTTLFGKPFVNEELSVQPCQLGAHIDEEVFIKLARSRVSVHVESAMIIEADMRCCKGNPIVTGSVTFEPSEFGNFEGYIDGKPEDSHLMHVKVKWEKIDFVPNDQEMT